MHLHVLSGDSLLEPFKELGLEGEVSVFRECLVDGPASAADLNELFALRSRFLASAKDEGFYESSVRPEIEKIFNSPKDTEIFLWFEHELFCQTNLWFLLNHLEDRDNVWFVFPPTEPFERRFAGWASLDAEMLAERFEKRISVSDEDRSLGSELWQAFSERDSDRLKELGTQESEIFLFLPEVTKAAAEIESRPESSIREIVARGVDEFGPAFREFGRKESVYGFGDLQVKAIWDRVAADT